MKKIVFLSILFSIFSFANAQSHFSTQSHQALVTNIEAVADTTGWDTAYFSSGEDGFLIRWGEDNQGEHYQISDVGIKLIAVSPNGNDVAVYETDGGSVNKVSVWDWKTLTRKYQKNFSDSITSLKFSAKGNYLIIGTATVDGAIFIRTASWTIIDKVKANTSIVNYIATSDSEKTVVFYSPAGTLSYFNLMTGQLKQKFQVIQGLTTPVMFNNNIFLAGIKDNAIYILNAFKGTTVTSIQAQNPIILSGSKDKNFYYLEYDGRNNYELKMLEVQDDMKISNPRLVKSFRGPRGEAAICVGTKHFGDLYLGARNGAIYRADTEATSTPQSFVQITENKYKKIYDIDECLKDFFFLTDENNIILWTKSSRAPVIKKDLSTQAEEVLFTPKSSLQSVRLFNVSGIDYLVEIESNSEVNIFDFEKKTLKEVYSGTGIQDAILAQNGNLYVAKSAATNPQVPLLCVNPDTLETVPLGVKGNVAYALSIKDNMIYGINLVSDETGKTTYVFSFNIESKVLTNILKFSNEDSDVFTYLKGGNLFTNIGKNKVYCYNIASKKRFAYNRSSSIPVDICQNGNQVVILNSNGSISWCSPTSQTLKADWYLTNDEQWFEF
jgi:WD40 repeat protein